MFKRLSFRSNAFFSTPSLAFEAMLKMTKVKIELLTDIDMVLMTEKAMRGGSNTSG